MDKTARIKELIQILNRAAKAYYTEGAEIMSNFEYDALYDELVALEAETGVVFADSPTVNVGYETAKELVKERHESPMLSLDKTKEPSVLAEFLGGHPGLLSWKLDGLTVVMTFEGGVLSKAVTRGNGEIGEIVTANAKTFVNVPHRIPFAGKLIVRGEAVIKYSDFERINEQIPEAEAKYKNPRNLCSGSVRQLDSSITAARSVNFYVFSLESAVNEDGTQVNFSDSNEQKFVWLKSQGFDVVDHKRVSAETIEAAVKEFAAAIVDFDVPSDGLVLLLDEIEYGKSLGRTAKFPRNSIAFKWKDELAETILLDVEWSPSRTGLINPVAIFESVELEGTTVSRASLHNISIIEGLELGLNDRITVYKANMIIPQIAENLTRSGALKIADTCPACHAETVIKNEQGVKTLTCPNPECPAKKIKSFANYVSRNCLNIDGISEETLEKFIGHGFIAEFDDIYKLNRFKNEIINMPGFGEKSYDNIIKSVDTSRKTTAARLLAGLGITGVGTANAKVIARFFGNDFEQIRSADFEQLCQIEGVGDVIAGGVISYFADEKKAAELDRILAELTFEEEAVGDSLKGLTFVVTGSLNTYENRDALKTEIESKGGKVSGSVSAKTSYLINNDALSGSSKNKTAKSLGIPIITEQEFIERFR